MSNTGFRKRFTAATIATVYGLAVAIVSLVVPIGSASAMLAPLPEPTAPSATPNENCEWMGEMQYKNTEDNTTTTTDVSQQRKLTESIHIVTAQVPGESCGLRWSGEKNDYIAQQSSVCENNWVATVQSTGFGAGLIAMALSPTETTESWLSLNPTTKSGGTTTYTRDDLRPECANDDYITTDWTPIFDNSNCVFDAAFESKGLFINTNSQATVGTCAKHIHETTATTTTNIDTEISWRFKKVNCDTTIDSDNGGANDCQEYADKTDPMNATDDTKQSDLTQPTITLDSPLNGGSVILGTSATASFSCEDEDGGSGLASCTSTVANGSNLDTASVGVKTFVVTATDNAGNTATATASYTVMYQNSGFTGSVSNDVINKAKAGQMVPVQFRLLDGNGSPISTFSSVVSITSVATCDATGSTNVVLHYPGGGGLQYLGDGNWQYNWKTTKAYAGQCRTLYLTLADGSKASARFQF